MTQTSAQRTFLAILFLSAASYSPAGDDPGLRGGQLFPGAKPTYALPKRLASRAQAGITITGSKNPRIDGQHYEAIDKTYRILIPWLSTGRIKVADEAVRPGVTNMVRFTDSEGWVAVVISTQVKASWPKDKSILDYTLRKSAAALRDWPAGQSCLQQINGPLGKANQWIIKNVDDPSPGLFPLGVRIKGRPDLLETIGITREIASEGYLYEFAAVLPIGKGTRTQQAVALAQETVDELMSGWEPSSRKPAPRQERSR